MVGGGGWGVGVGGGGCVCVRVCVCGYVTFYLELVFCLFFWFYHLNVDEYLLIKSQYTVIHFY